MFLFQLFLRFSPCRLLLLMLLPAQPCCLVTVYRLPGRIFLVTCQFLYLFKKVFSWSLWGGKGKTFWYWKSFRPVFSLVLNFEKPKILVKIQFVNFVGWAHWAVHLHRYKRLVPVCHQIFWGSLFIKHTHFFLQCTLYMLYGWTINFRCE